MKKILCSLGLLAVAIGVFAAIAVGLRDTAFAEIGKNYGLFGNLMAGLGTILITPPAMSLLASVFALGVEKHRSTLEDKGGPRSLQLRKGSKWGGVALATGLWAAIIFALRWEGASLGLWLFTLPLHLMCLYAILVFLLVQAHYDAKTLVAMDWTLRSRSYNWTDLEGLAMKPDTQELVLHFAGNRRARLSLYFNHLNQAIAFAEARIKENALARTARG